MYMPIGIYRLFDPVRAESKSCPAVVDTDIDTDY